MVLIGNVYEKIWEWMAVGARYMYAPPLQCRQSRIFRPAPAQTVSLGPDIEGGAFDIEGARRLRKGVLTIFEVNFVEAARSLSEGDDNLSAFLHATATQ